MSYSPPPSDPDSPQSPNGATPKAQWASRLIPAFLAGLLGGGLTYATMQFLSNSDPSVPAADATQGESPPVGAAPNSATTAPPGQSTPTTAASPAATETAQSPAATQATPGAIGLNAPAGSSNGAQSQPSPQQDIAQVPQPGEQSSQPQTSSPAVDGADQPENQQSTIQQPLAPTVAPTALW